MNKPVCEECGKVHERGCRAHKNGVRPLVPCGRKPKLGSPVCRSHGGAAKQVVKKTAEREQERKAAEIMKSFGKAVPHNPVEGLLEEIFWVKGHLVWLRSKVQDTSPGDLIWGVTEYSDESGHNSEGSLSKNKTVEKAAPSIWLKLYNEQQKIYGELVDKALRNGIEERRIQLAERMGDQLLLTIDRVADGILRSLAKLGWDEDELEEVWPAMVAEVIPEALSEIEKANRE